MAERLYRRVNIFIMFFCAATGAIGLLAFCLNFAVDGSSFWSAVYLLGAFIANGTFYLAFVEWKEGNS